MDDYKNEQRLGAREPRSKLLPPYLRSQYFQDFSDAIDTVWDDQVQPNFDVIKNLRHMWVTNPDVEAKIDRSEMIELDDWTRPERQILVKQVNLLGMKLKSAGLLTDQNYLTVSRFLGMYWFGKGTQAFVAFINFALILDLEVYNLWSQRQQATEVVKIATSVTRPVTLYLAYSQVASGIVMVNGTTVGTFINAQPNSQIPITWIATQYNMNGNNVMSVSDEGNFGNYFLQVQLQTPISFMYSYPLFQVPEIP